MSTKACIARPDGRSWSGYYVHSDGHPHHTGRVIVEMGRARGLDAVFDYAASAPQGWTHFPDEPSIHHDEPFILSPEQDGGIEWLYMLQTDRGIAVYRAEGWGDPDVHHFTHVATVDPSRPDARAEMTALTDFEPGVDVILAGLDAETGSAPARRGNGHVRGAAERRDVLARTGNDPVPPVSVPDSGVRMAPDEVVALLKGGDPRRPGLGGEADAMDERDFWAEVRRWLKIQTRANGQMVAAIERRFGPFGEQRRQEARRPTPAG